GGAPGTLGDDTPAVAFRQRKGTWLPGTVPGASGVPRRAGGAPADVRWRTGGFPGADRIELPGLVDRGERVDPAAAEFQARTGHEVDDRSRDEGLAALRQPCDAHADVHDDPVRNAGDHVALAGVEAETDVLLRRARFGADRAAAPDSPRRSVEHNEHAALLHPHCAAAESRRLCGDQIA